MTIGAGINSVVRFGSSPPDFVFHQHFNSYLLFDAPIGSSFGFSAALRALIEDCLPSATRVNVFCALDGEALGTLDLGDAFCEKLDLLVRSEVLSGNIWGCVVATDGFELVAYQLRPAEVGVLALNCETKVDSTMKEIFFSCSEIRGWIKSPGEPRAAAMENMLHDPHLEKLLKNYCKLPLTA